MIEIDWGNVRPTDQERRDVESRLAALPIQDRSIVTLSRRGAGFEARLSMISSGAPTEVRLQDEDIGLAIERLVQLMDIVFRERRSTSH